MTKAFSDGPSAKTLKGPHAQFRLFTVYHRFEKEQVNLVTERGIEGRRSLEPSCASLFDVWVLQGLWGFETQIVVVEVVVVVSAVLCCCFYCLFALEGVGEPVQSVKETVSARGAGGDDVPLAVAKRVQAKLLGDIRNSHGVGQVLFVGKDEDNSVAQLILSQQLLQLKRSLIDTLTIVRVNHVDDTLSVQVVVAPQGTNLVLTSNVPAKIGECKHEELRVSPDAKQRNAKWRNAANAAGKC